VAVVPAVAVAVVVVAAVAVMVVVEEVEDSVDPAAIWAVAQREVHGEKAVLLGRQEEAP